MAQQNKRVNRRCERQRERGQAPPETFTDQNRFEQRRLRKENVTDYRQERVRVENDPFRESQKTNAQNQTRMLGNSLHQQYASVARPLLAPQIAEQISNLVEVYVANRGAPEDVAFQEDWKKIISSLERATNITEMLMTMYTQLPGRCKKSNQPPLLTPNQYIAMARGSESGQVALLIQRIWSSSFIISKRADIIRAAKINYITPLHRRPEDCFTPKQFIGALIYLLEKLD